MPEKIAKPWFLYLIECIDGSIYTGITTDVKARYAAHCAGKGARYTRARPPVELLAWQMQPDRAAAARAEYRVKQLSPQQKRQLARNLAMQIQLSPAVQLLHATRHAVLSTHSTQLPGFPFGTAVPLVLDERQQPLLLISALAEHTKNLLADSRASLAVVEGGKDNVQDAARITLVGRCEPCEASPALVERYFRYLPEAAQYLQLDFMFFRLVPERARFIGGIGRMGWIDGADWQALPAITLEEEKSLLDEFTPQLAPPDRLLGIDAFGVDIEHAGLRQRRPFAQAGNPEEIRHALRAMDFAPATESGG
ncbi:GIY-YIG nuclease family protein [uncultured Azonexus sp.]|uniref:GIY-YIG nuclease family protein n=1 Tax=uncultured Azonexus sp. TaxID=520307 RepID=UPI00261CE4AF|nr:GIY-YIG nuclease family protein [uncultured Azonexus sp.]